MGQIKERVCIESPYAGDIATNIAYARAALKYCLLQGVAPYASHLLYTQVLDDLKPEERKLGMLAGFTQGDACDARWFFLDLGYSGGMESAMGRVKRLGQPYREIKIGPDWRGLLSGLSSEAVLRFSHEGNNPQPAPVDRMARRPATDDDITPGR